MPRDATSYVGRFAPSPTGPLHLGSLIAALASFLAARHRGGTWLVRMEDIDPPREEPGASGRILHSLQAHGLHWDGPVLYQSTRGAAYDTALDALGRVGHLFSCDCTRANMGPGGSCCGTCRNTGAATAPSALRVAVPAACRIDFDDVVQGAQSCALGRELPDFIVRRKDGLYAYQLAVVVDDEQQGITEIVRGSDLLESTARQIYLQQLLGCRTPDYMHVPILTDGQGRKFSKQNHAPPLDDAAACDNLRSALHFLRQPQPGSDLDTPERLLRAATASWSPRHMPQSLSLDLPSRG